MQESANKNGGLTPAILALLGMSASGSNYLPKRHTRPLSNLMLFCEAPPKCV
jgi:hypothetical protein